MRPVVAWECVRAWAIAFGAVVSSGCAGAASSNPGVTASLVAGGEGSDAGAAAGSTLEQGRWGVFHSRRFDFGLALPDGRAWRIDDHRTPWLRALHPGSASSIVARVWNEPQRVTREHCYRQARNWDASLADIDSAQVVEDALRPLKGGLETRVTVGLEAPQADAARTTSGFVIASAALVRKCLVVVFRTTSADPEVVAARLALVASRVVPSVELESELSPSPAPAAPRH